MGSDRCNRHLVDMPCWLLALACLMFDAAYVATIIQLNLVIITDISLTNFGCNPLPVNPTGMAATCLESKMPFLTPLSRQEMIPKRRRRRRRRLLMLERTSASETLQ